MLKIRDCPGDSGTVGAYAREIGRERKKRINKSYQIKERKEIEDDREGLFVVVFLSPRLSLVHVTTCWSCHL